MSTKILQFDPSQSAGKAVRLSLADNIDITMVWCPPGTFKMGSADDDPFASNQATSWRDIPQRRVELSQGFWMGVTPVTWRQWVLLMPQEKSIDLFSDDPVIPHNYHDAIAFCEKLTQLWQEKGILHTDHRVSLPSEAQWEYACRAGTETTWYFGNDLEMLDRHAWYKGHDTQSVGLKESNPWGLFDLYGNVSEWCLDDVLPHDVLENGAVDPVKKHEKGLEPNKVARGGDYYAPAKMCRSASRYSGMKENPFNDPIGLRIVCVRDRH